MKNHEFLMISVVFNRTRWAFHMMFTRGSNDEPTAELPHEALHATRGAHDAAPHDRQHDQLHAVRFTYKLYVYNGNMYTQ